MSNALKMAAGLGSSVTPTYVDDVFSTYLYAGNNSTQTINNGIDLAGKGGMVWTKRRSAPDNNYLTDTVRGNRDRLFSSLTAAADANADISSFNSNGYSLDNFGGGYNANTDTYVSWTFRRSPKFFDVVTYSGNNAIRQVINHSLGQVPGMIIIKKVSGGTSNWSVWHKDLTSGSYLKLNLTDAQAADSFMNGVNAPTATTFTAQLSTSDGLNAIGTNNYVAYLFAHDTSTDGIIQCGSFTTDGSGDATVNHGWSAGLQFAMIKVSSTTGDWEMYDTNRTPGWTGSDARLRANLANAEDAVTRLSASGTSVSFTGLSASSTYIYVFVASPT